MAGLPLQKLEEQMTCSVCLTSFSDPRVLRCFHTYCRSCLESLLTKTHKQPGEADTPLQIVCPTCREVTPLPENGVAGLKTDFKIPGLIELRDYITAVQQPRAQDTQNEEIKVRKAATISTGDSADSPEEQKKQMCPEHDNEELEFYCETCEEVICSKCFIKRHNGHKYSNVSEIASVHRQELSSLLQQVETNLSSAEEVLSKIETTGDKISSRKILLETEVDKEIAELHEVVEARKAELIKQLNGITRAKMKELSRETNKKREMLADLRSSVDQAKEAMKENGEAEMKLLKRLKDIDKKFSDEEDLLKVFTEADMDFLVSPKLTQSCSHYGQILTPECLDPLMCTVRGKGLQLAEVNETASIFLTINNHQGEPYVQLIDLLECELAQEETGLKVKCDIESREQNSFKITYKPTNRGKHQLVIKVNRQHIKGSPFSVTIKRSVEKLQTPVSVIQDVTSPWGVAVSKDGKVVVVTECHESRVSVFNNNGERLHPPFGRLGSEPGELKSPRGVALDDEGNVYVADSRNYRIQKFTLDGKYVACDGCRGSKPFEFADPKDIAFNPINRKLYITDITRVKIRDENLAFSGSFGGRGVGPGQFVVAYGIACDMVGNVYVTDKHNNRIQVFSPSGEFLRVFQGGDEPIDSTTPKGFIRSFLGGRKTPPVIGFPIGIAVDESGHVFVSEDGSHRVSVLAHDGCHVTSFGGEGVWLGEFKHPKAIAVSQGGFVYICDFENNRVQVY